MFALGDMSSPVERDKYLYLMSMLKKTYDLESPLISVIIPTHNRPDMLSRAVKSVCCQSYDNFEIIIVDDHSDYETEKVCAELLKNQKIKYFKSPSYGPSSARNCGIENASGFFVTGLDDDDLFTPKRLEILLSAYDSKFAFVAARSAIFDNSLPVVDEENGKSKTFSLHKMLDTNRIGNQVLVETARIIAVGGYDENLQIREDYDLWIRLVARYGPAKVITNKLYLRNESRTYWRLSKSEKRQTGLLKFYEKHNGRMTFYQRYRLLKLIYELEWQEMTFLQKRFFMCRKLFSNGHGMSTF